MLLTYLIKSRVFNELNMVVPDFLTPYRTLSITRVCVCGWMGGWVVVGGCVLWGVQFDYYQLPFCEPRKIHDLPENLGEVHPDLHTPSASLSSAAPNPPPGTAWLHLLNMIIIYARVICDDHM